MVVGAEFEVPGRAPIWVCFNPSCSETFVPQRPWQRYCCEGCRKADEQEFRRVGQKAAPALLAWRMGKHGRYRGAFGMETVTPELRAVSNVARGYVTRLQSEWFADRMRRSGEAMRCKF